MKGMLYGVGVGPGDPELMTLKAVRIIKENDVIAVPGREPASSSAYNTVVQAVPGMAQKTLIPINVPMTKDRRVVFEAVEKGAKTIEEYMERGENVVYITLGDPTVYSTFAYLQEIVSAHGFETRYISGVPSFCAAAASLGIPLAQWDESFAIIPAVHEEDFQVDANVNYVCMKAGREMKKLGKMLSESGHNVCAVENCGMDGEKLYFGEENIPDEAGYFSIVIGKKGQDEKN